MICAPSLEFRSLSFPFIMAKSTKKAGASPKHAKKAGSKRKSAKKSTKKAGGKKAKK